MCARVLVGSSAWLRVVPLGISTQTMNTRTANSVYHVSSMQLELRNACTIPHAIFLGRMHRKYIGLHFQQLKGLSLGMLVQVKRTNGLNVARLVVNLRCQGLTGPQIAQ